MIPLTEVQSSMLKAVGWQNDTLEVVFNNNPDTVYQYHGVTERAVRMLLDSKSVGQAFNLNFRDMSHQTRPLYEVIQSRVAVIDWMGIWLSMMPDVPPSESLHF